MNQTDVKPLEAPQKKKKDAVQILARLLVSPWLVVATVVATLVFAVVVLAGLYLMWHPEYVITAMKYPWALGFLVALLPVTISIKLVFNGFSVIEQWLSIQVERLRNSDKGYFWEVVIVFFMIVSVADGGQFYNDVTRGAIWGLSGYASVFLLDLVSVVLINAMRTAKVKGNPTWVYMTGILLCASLSAYGNLYSAFENFHASAAIKFPLFNEIAPYTGIMFPLLILFMAVSRSVDVDVDDAETYKKQQQRRVDFLRAKREIFSDVTHEMEQIRLLQQREFILKSLFFPQRKIVLIVETVKTYATGLISEQVKTLKEDLENKQKNIDIQLQEIQGLHQDIKKMEETYQQHLETITATVTQLDALYNKPQTWDISGVLSQVEPMITDRLVAVEARLLRQFSAKITTGLEEGLGDVQEQVSDQIKTAKTQVLSEVSLRLQVLLSQDNGERKTGGLDPKLKTYGLSSEDLQTVLNRYPGVMKWVSASTSSASRQEIADVTGLTPKMVSIRIAKSDFTAPKNTKNPDLFLISSVLKWLVSAPISVSKSDPITDAIPVINGSENVG